MPVTQQTPTASNARRSREPSVDAIGPWRLVRLLGEGEWCQVYQAAPLHAAEQSSAVYAVKRLRPTHSDNPQAITQLQHEEFVAGSIAHPHVACVLSSHIDRPPYYLVMPYQQGDTLRGHLWKSHPLAPAQSLWIVRQVAEGLNAMHDQGWAHCDVKPENIQIAASGHATLCDLGLARRLDGSADLASVMTGTPAYMPPESFVGKGALSPAGDSYSLGIMLFEMLTGQLPFPQSDPDELIAAHLQARAPDPRRWCVDLPTIVIHLMQRLMAKEPLRRPSGRELIDSLVDAEIDCFDLRPLA